MKQNTPAQTPLQDKGNGHTPGQWIKQDNIVYIKEGSVNIYAIAVIENDYPVAYALINSKITTKQAKTNAALIASAPQLKSDNQKKEDTIKELLGALNKIKNWELPSTGQFWDREEKQPMSYGAAYGSNGERDYFKNIASEAIAKHNQ